jgi:hypothetical protein
MPSVPARWLETILYVYKDAESAQRSAHHGATATLISVRAEHPALRTLNLQHMYVMTNSHAVLKGAALRVNAKDGSGVDIFEIPASGWIHHQDGDDVAMAPIRQAPSQGLLAVNIDQFLTEELAVTWGIAPGDDCFFIGRHMYLDGKARNTPAVRFGNLSILDPEPIHQSERKYDQQSVVVEARSLNGYSGSPVFVVPGSDLQGDGEKVIARTVMNPPCFLLAIDWGHQGLRRAITGVGYFELSQAEENVVLNSGMMLVVPAWRLLGLINSEPLMRMRRQAEAEARRPQALRHAEDGRGRQPRELRRPDPRVVGRSRRSRRV